MCYRQINQASKQENYDTAKMSNLEIDFGWSKEYRYVDPFPVEIWILILSFFNSSEAFPVALVCKLFYEILAEQSLKRGDYLDFFGTNLIPLCRTIKSIHFIRDTSNFHFWQHIKVRIPYIIAEQKNYTTLVEFVSTMLHKDHHADLYRTLMINREYDAVCILIETHTLNTLDIPINDIELAIKSGHTNLVRVMWKKTVNHRLVWDNIQDAIMTGNLDIVMFVMEQIPLSALYKQPINFTFAIERGFTDILEYLLVTNDCRIHDSDYEFLYEKYPKIAAKVDDFNQIV